MNTFGVLLCCVILLFAYAHGAEGQDTTRKCLDCICYASTKCDEKIGCHNAGPESYFCGPYQITHAYWIDAGKPGNVDHFEKCIKEKHCSEQTVIQYMNKFGTDCDNDGKVTCNDYARMHKAGRFGCSADWVDNSDFWKQYNECMAGNAAK